MRRANSSSRHWALQDWPGRCGGWTYQAQGVPFRLDYTGATQTLATGLVEREYMFTLYGAAAGQKDPRDADCSSAGPHGCTVGYGGMAQGSKRFAPATALSVEVGGQGMNGGVQDSGEPGQHNTPGGMVDDPGAYNGGGRGSRGGSGGGGATDIRTVAGDLSSRLLVAAGGGGCGDNGCEIAGGDGGGLTGENGLGGNPGTGGSPGGPGTGGSPGLGVGGDYVMDNDCGGGGGGWYGGGSGPQSNTPGGGGSSYYDGMDGDKSTSSGVNEGDGYAEYIFR